MVRLTTFQFRCRHCLKDSPKFFNKEQIEAIRVMEETHGWSLEEDRGEHYLRCPECTAEIDRRQEELMKD